MLKVLDVDGAVTRTAGGWAATGKPWEYDGERYERVARERTREQQAMLAYQAATGCRMEFLRRELDDPEAAPCGRCDNCTCQRWPTGAPAARTEAAKERLARPGATVEPRKMWPTGMKELGIDAAGKIPATALAEPGRALGRLTDLGWGSALRALLSEQTPDGPITDQLANATVAVLASWNWKQRPAAVVAMPSRTRPELIASLAQRISVIGRLPYLGALGYATEDGPGPRRHNSAQRLATVWRALTIPPDLAEAVQARGVGPVLLVDDQIDTGWTMTVAAMLLRQAGAPAVLPYALAVTTG